MKKAGDFHAPGAIFFESYISLKGKFACKKLRARGSTVCKTGSKIFTALRCMRKIVHARWCLRGVLGRVNLMPGSIV